MFEERIQSDYNWWEQPTEISGLESFSNGHMSNVDAPERHRSSLRGRRNLKRTINHLDSDSEPFEFASTSSRQELRPGSDEESHERPKIYMPTGSGDFQCLNDYDLRGPSSSSYSLLGDLPGPAPHDNDEPPKENDTPISPDFENNASKDTRPPWAPILRVLNNSDCDMLEAETTISHIVSTGGRPWQFTWADNPERPYHQSRVFFCVAPTGGQQKRREQERYDRRKSVEMSKWHWICCQLLCKELNAVTEDSVCRECGHKKCEKCPARGNDKFPDVVDAMQRQKRLRKK